MLTQPLLDKLAQLRLTGFRQALEEQLAMPHYADLSFEERLGLLLDVEVTRRHHNRLKRRIQHARFPLQATMEDLDLSSRRGLHKAEVLQLSQSEWVGQRLNMLVLGPTGAGKTYLAAALGRAACEAGYTVLYTRTSRLLQSIKLAQADGSFPQLLQRLSRTQLLIFDDWLRDALSRSQARDLLEILDDRYGLAATMIVTQVPVIEWHAQIPDPTLADAILDRLIHNAYRLELKGESMRKIHSLLAAQHN
ncbi:MAG: IS21-like element helper ATPase IstB [Anaerolineales bacterium]|nr:IS21-like element helper ATPase IstB [Anaerolineales bacterium]